MSSWKTVNLGEICEIERGGSPRPISEFVTNDEDGVNWIKITDATATELAMVEEKIVWNTLMPLRRRLAATASSTPSTRPRGTV